MIAPHPGNTSEPCALSDPDDGDPFQHGPPPRRGVFFRLQPCGRSASSIEKDFSLHLRCMAPLPVSNVRRIF